MRSATSPTSRPATSARLPQLGERRAAVRRLGGRNILADVEGKPAQPFHYHDKGIMAMIGRKAAVAEVGEHRHELHGRIAFAAWLGVHAQLLREHGSRGEGVRRLGGRVLCASAPSLGRAARPVDDRHAPHRLDCQRSDGVKGCPKRSQITLSGR